ncbi:hypothetical protein H0H81_000864 [Sphagnurus paluster]|uniref:Uncharacterized protein n=1 Tax=Sphagnurus paluster TaxID=117069 RepID=A0A9P7GNJ0_9AGAR|nr:hypothetical protein H0H81_000864 [Sphagnurus paluster]
MAPPTQEVIVMLESQVSAVPARLSKLDTISAIIDYTTVVADSSIAENYVRIPPKLNQRYGGEMTAFFAAEASSIAAPLTRISPKSFLSSLHARNASDA